ncbi:MAG: hypothetical protein ACOCM4_02610 [Acetivibrio ethanolgignens]
MHGFEKMVEMIVTIVLLFLVPIQYAGAKADILNRSYVMTETAYLVDSVRTTGKLTRQMYEEYEKKLGITRQVYEIELVHYKKLLNETKEGYQTYFQGVYTADIKEQLFLETGSYELLAGDFFRVQVNRVSSSLAERFSLFFGMQDGRTDLSVEAVYGGRVHNEAR